VSIHLTKPHLLVVGGTGFIGYHVALTARRKGWKVTSVSINSPKKHKHIDGVHYLKIDISNIKELKKKLVGSFTYVVNLGGYVSHKSFEDKRGRITKAHLIGVVNLTKIFYKKKIKKFVQIGSSVEYGEIKAPQSENQHGLPHSTYALAKLAATQFLLMLYNTKKFPVTILRFFQVYGPKQDENRFLPQIIKGCLNNKKFPTSNGDQVRDFCYISDVVNAIFLTLVSKKVNGEIFNIGSGEPIKIKYVINQVLKIIGKGKAQFGKIKYRENENMQLYPKIKKARDKLKWRPKINFNHGIRLVINSYR